MYILAIETATPAAGAAVINEEKVLAVRTVNNQKTHSQNLLPLVAQVLNDAQIKLKDIGLLAVSSGPGSFTGLRIGFSTAKTLAQVNETPLIGVSTLDTLAWQLSGREELICPLMNAKRNEVYTALYQMQGAELVRLCDYQALSPELLAARLLARGQKVVFTGDGLAYYEEQLQQSLGTYYRAALYTEFLPRPEVTAWLGLRQYRQNGAVELYDFLPFYLRPSEAERKRAAQQHRQPAEKCQDAAAGNETAAAKSETAAAKNEARGCRAGS